jgi:hypothetical protein
MDFSDVAFSGPFLRHRLELPHLLLRLEEQLFAQLLSPSSCKTTYSFSFGIPQRTVCSRCSCAKHQPVDRCAQTRASNEKLAL